MTKSMDIDWFILALGCFITRSGNVRTIWCDNGSHFVGAERVDRIYGGDESQQNLEFHAQSKCRLDCGEKKSTFSKPHGWSLGLLGSILSSLLRTHSSSLDEESLNTLFAEVEAIIN